jgi:hypothetical protein
MLRAHAAAGRIPTAPPLPPLHLHLVGRGNVEHLALPPEVEAVTTVHFNQPYPDYYEQVGFPLFSPSLSLCLAQIPRCIAHACARRTSQMEA